MIAVDELRIKIAHLAEVVRRCGKKGILLTPEGALRRLTGTRHQIVDIAPDADSPLRALVRVHGSDVELTYITTRIEHARIRDQLPEIFQGVPDVRVEYREALPHVSEDIVVPSGEGYAEIIGEIVRPLLGGFAGNQFRKLEWLCGMTTAVLYESALQLEPGMNGSQVRGIVIQNLARQDIECNLMMPALAGQEKHFHPLYNSRYRIADDGWIKLVVGSRYSELIFSATLMARFGAPISREERRLYAALQEAAVEYAGLYRSGAVESDLHREAGTRFMAIERKHGIAGFHSSACFHHMGGPTSPLGNRDYLIEAGGTRRMFPWMQFAINPVDVFQSLKVELQGITMPEGAPRMLKSGELHPHPALTDSPAPFAAEIEARSPVSSCPGGR
jgi:Xaa-Pro aminopeptidase